MQEYIWYNVSVTDAAGKLVVNSRIGSVDNSVGLYAVVGPMGGRDSRGSRQGRTRGT